MAGTRAADCTLAMCPVEEGFLSVSPSLEGAAFMLAAFSALIPINLWIGARCKTTSYTVAMVIGLLLEVMGYVGMLLLRSDLASKTYFLLLVLGTVIGPTFITAAIYTILPHIMGLYGSDVGIVPDPCWLSYFFLFSDAFTVAFQAVGAAFAAEGFDKAETTQGVNVLLAGLAFQIASILGFFGAYYLFMSKVVQGREFLDPRFSDIYLSARFKTALICMQVALTFILARTVARIVQFSSGLGSTLSQSQVYTLVLDGGLVLVATILITIIPPAPSLGRAWGATSPSRTKAHRHLATLDSIQRSPGSPLLYLQGSPAPSTHTYPNGYGHVYGPSGTTLKEPRSPPPSVTTDNSGTAVGSGYGHNNNNNNNNNNYGHGQSHSHVHTQQAGDYSGAPQQPLPPLPGNPRRYSPNWVPMAHKRHVVPVRAGGPAAEPPPYERPASNYTRVPYMPPQTLSQQYGQGTIVESQIVAPGSEGSRTGGSGSGGGGGGVGGGGSTAQTGRTRRSPRAYEDDLVRHDAIW